MRRCCSIVFLSLLLVSFAEAAPEPVMVRSRSGQFLIRGLPLTRLSFDRTTNGVSYVRLDPTVFAVSCERIKEAVLGAIGLEDQWRGLIAINLHPNNADNEPIDVLATRYKNNWGYRIDIPERIDRRRVIKAVVEVVLLEAANRRAGERSAELPLWLGEGLTSYLEATTLASISLEPETTIFRREKHPDALKNVRETLSTQAALTFGQLSMPDESLLVEPEAKFYGDCAHLFVHELLGFKDGRRCLQGMVLQLGEHLNWQTAFLRSFAGHFPRLIDVDKWWSLITAGYHGKETSILWSQTETWRQLDSTLITPVEVRLRPEDLPIRTLANLQRILSEWDYAKQFPVLRLKVNHLQALRLRVPTETEPLVAEYIATLEHYLEKRGQPVSDNGKLKRKARKAIEEAVRRLDELDARREAARLMPRPNVPQSTSG